MNGLANFSAREFQLIEMAVYFCLLDQLIDSGPESRYRSGPLFDVTSFDLGSCHE